MTEGELGFLLVGFFFGASVGVLGMLGLYLGERGRRKDAQRREGKIRVDRPLEPVVTPPGGRVPQQTESDISDARELWVAETMAEVGCSREEAVAEYNSLLSRVMGESAQ